MALKLTFLGTGTSHGIPVIACDCGVCTSADPRNLRTRCSVLVEWEGRSILVDTATELRLQAVRQRLRRVDTILFTHSHADHICGLDDVRRFNDVQRAHIPCYGNDETVANLARQFWYVFADTQAGGGKPRLELNVVDGQSSMSILGLDVVPLPVLHGRVPVLGYRFGNLAYITDTNAIPEETMSRLADLDVLVLGALRHRRHVTHFSIPEALEVVERLKPRRTLFTHICHDVDHEEVSRSLPAGVELAYDGLVVDLD